MPNLPATGNASEPEQSANSMKILGYDDWNRRITQRFFTGARAQRPVWLSVDDETLRELGGDVDELVLSVRGEAETRGCRDIQELGLELHSEWQEEVEKAPTRPPPSFVAVLAIYVIAVNHGGEKWLPHTYYDRLHDLLWKPRTRIGSIRRSVVLWRSLEHWSMTLERGRLGCFRASITGRQTPIGMPRRQILLAPRERGALALAFLEAGLASARLAGAEPSDVSLLRAARRAGDLLRRTKKLLQQWPRQPDSRDLVDEIRHCFHDWDPLETDADSGTNAAVSLPLRVLLLKRGNVLEGAVFSTDIVKDLTDSDCHNLVKPDSETPEVFRLEESDSQHALIVDQSGDPQWAATADWFAPLSFELRDSHVTLKRPAADFLVFGLGRRIDYLREISGSEVEPGHNYLLMRLAKGASSEPRFVPLSVDDEEWRALPFRDDIVFKRFKAAEVDEATPQRAKIHLKGGIERDRSRRGFLRFGLPTVDVELPEQYADAETLFVASDRHGTKVAGRLVKMTPPESQADGDLTLGAETALITEWSIEDLADDCRSCRVEVVQDEAEVGALSFYIDDDPVVGEPATPVARDRFGRVAPPDTAVIRGLDVDCGGIAALARLPVANRPALPSDPASFLDDAPAQRVMQLLRVHHRVSWPRAKRLLPLCSPQGERTRDLAHTVRHLHALGVLELEESDRGRLSSIAELQPRLVLLARLTNRYRAETAEPWNSYEAITAGCWLPQELQKLKRLANKHGAEIYARPRAGASLPSYRSLFVFDGPVGLDRLRELAATVGVRFDGTPPLAYRLASALSDLRELEASDGWYEGGPADTFEIQYFDPRRLCLRPDRPPEKARYSMCECRPPEIPIWQHFIVDHECDRRLEVGDRQLGRWFVRLMVLPDTPIPSELDDIFVPQELRLPPILERVMIMSSGRSPVLTRFERRTSPFWRQNERQRFRIPPPEGPEPRWWVKQTSYSGLFVRYPGVYGTAAWPSKELVPMLGLSADEVGATGLKEWKP